VADVELPGYQILSRERLDAELVLEAVKAGAAFLPRTQAGLTDMDDDTRSVVLRTGDQEVEVSTRVVLAADGLGGRLLRSTDEFDSTPLRDSRIGAGAISETASDYYKPGVIYMACASGGYVGAGRLEDGRLVVAATYDAAFVRECGGLAEAAVRVLAEAGFPEIDDIRSISWKGTPALTRRASRVSAHRAFVLGDAAGYVEPFTGEGMKWAMCSGVALAAIATKAIRKYDVRFEREWETKYRQIVSNRQAVCRLLAAGLRRPWLVRASVRAVAAVPIVATPFVSHLNAPLECLKDFLTL
jgi:flavin-dependent dehydrogenase